MADLIEDHPLQGPDLTHPEGEEMPHDLHKKKRRKRKHKVRKHSPEYYEELKLAKINRKRES